MSEQFTWEQAVSNTTSKIIGSPFPLRVIQEAFMFIACEWAEIPIIDRLPFHSRLCADGTPVEFSIKVKEDEKLNFRFVAEPFCPGLDKGKQYEFSRIRAHEFIKRYSSQQSANLVDQVLNIFPKKDEPSHDVDSLIWLGLAIDLDGEILGSKLYINSRAASPAYSRLGAISNILVTLGFPGDNLEPIIKLITKYKARSEGIGIDFYKSKMGSVKVYLSSRMQLTELMQLEQPKSSPMYKERGFQFLSTLGNYVNSGAGLLVLEYRIGLPDPNIKFLLNCHDWFASDQMVIDTLINDKDLNKSLMKWVGRLRWEDNRGFTNFGLSNHGFTIYFKTDTSYRS